jgi:sulfofructose kinase
MTQGLNVVCLGKCAFDWILRLDHFPEPDGRQPIRSLVTTFGGPAATASVALARLGARVTFGGAMGCDELGRAIRENFYQQGVDCLAGDEETGTRSARTVILSDASTGLRTILYEESTAPFPPADAIFAALREAVHLHLDGAVFSSIEPSFLAHGRELGVTISVDAGTPIPRLSEFLDLIDCLVTPLARLHELSGEADIERGMRVLQAQGPPMVVVTMGKRGCVGVRGQAPTVWMSPFAVSVVDTTGAGDVFSGALAYAVHRYPDLVQALRFASAAAALSCTGVGGQDPCPTWEQVQILLDTLDNNPAMVQRSGEDV